jgi:hypothetical protein
MAAPLDSIKPELVVTVVVVVLMLLGEADTFD